MGHYSLAVFDYSGNKLCELMDSETIQAGCAQNITETKELGGWKELQFTLPLSVDGEVNYRWNFIKNDYLVRLWEDDTEDWFIIHKPKASKSNSTINQTVTCPHISAMLKTRGINKTFDDTNGIGTLPYLIDQILSGTGWSRGVCDTFFENDSGVEKVRSLSSDGKEGAYKLITDVCQLFQAYPVFNGDRTVDFFSLARHDYEWEFSTENNIKTLNSDYDSTDLITRMYVEGALDDDGYVTIDSVNPYGLNYLMNFDYYKSIGLFTDAHQAILDQYYADALYYKQAI